MGSTLSDDDKKSSTKKKKKRRSRGRSTKKGKAAGTRRDRQDNTAAPDLTATPAAKNGSTPSDSAPAPDPQHRRLRPRKAEPPKAPAPTMSFEEVDVSGKSAERQKPRCSALTQFKKGPV